MLIIVMRLIFMSQLSTSGYEFVGLFTIGITVGLSFTCGSFCISSAPWNVLKIILLSVAQSLITVLTAQSQLIIIIIIIIINCN